MKTMLQYPLEVPWQGTSNGYHNRFFHAEIRKIICGYPALIWGYKVEKICFWAYIICACQTWGNRILYSYLNTIRIHFLSNREVFCIRGFFRIKVFVFVFEYIAKVMYS